MSNDDDGMRNIGKKAGLFVAVALTASVAFNVAKYMYEPTEQSKPIQNQEVKSKAPAAKLELDN